MENDSRLQAKANWNNRPATKPDGVTRMSRLAREARKKPEYGPAHETRMRGRRGSIQMSVVSTKKAGMPR